MCGYHFAVAVAQSVLSERAGRRVAHSFALKGGYNGPQGVPEYPRLYLPAQRVAGQPRRAGKQPQCRSPPALDTGKSRRGMLIGKLGTPGATGVPKVPPAVPPGPTGCRATQESRQTASLPFLWRIT